MMIFRGRGRRRSTLVSKRRRGRALNSYVSQRRRVECGSHRVINTQRERRETFCRCALFMMCVRVCERKREQRKFFLWCFFLLPPLKKREKCGHRKCRPKDKRVTKGQDGQRTDKSLISLSLFCFVYASSQFFFQEEEKGQNHPSEGGAENPPSFAFLSVCALSRWCCCFIRARVRRKQASAQGRKTNKQRTEEQKISKKCQRGIFQQAKSGRF